MVAKKSDGTCPKKDEKGRKIVEDKKTKRCRLVKKSASRSAKSRSSSRSPCPPGSRRNRETGRCRKTSSASPKRKSSPRKLTPRKLIPRKLTTREIEHRQAIRARRKAQGLESVPYSPAYVRKLVPTSGLSRADVGFAPGPLRPDMSFGGGQLLGGEKLNA